MKTPDEERFAPLAESVPAESLRRMGQAMIQIANGLEGFDNEACIRILRAAAILHGIDLAAVGLAEILRSPSRKGNHYGD